MDTTSVRQRPAKSQSSAIPPAASSQPDEVEDQHTRVISRLDVLRVIITLIGVSCALSYYLTSGSSYLWNYNPWFLNAPKVGQWWAGPVNLTPDQLALFNGSDPSKPIYLAINGTIFDVSEGRHTYGPGGSYEVFAGRDASRAFVTGCFLEDRTGDLRGAEEIYIPIEDPDEEISSGARKTRAEKERREAKKRVLQEVAKWEAFYRNHKKYFEVGKLVGVPAYSEDAPKLCEHAQKGRPKRKNMKKPEDSAKAQGKPVQ
ncbi:dihydrofolate reductase [Exophiala viscosa]|uniref:dihydrofolate reductase n=1 Tax=Exophiala viscosa TaxID=2486360 RepID=UPI002193C0C1|nr:dihydrofolate reductase [Exophiala viscosa]